MFQAPGLTLSPETSEMKKQNNAQRLSGNGSSIFLAIFCPPAFPLVYADRVSGISRVFQKKWRSLTVSVLSTRFGFITSVSMHNTVGIVLLTTVVILSNQEQVLGLYYKRFIHFYKVLRP